MIFRTWFATIQLVILWSSALLCVCAHATGRDDVVSDPTIAGPAYVEPGQWRTKVQQVFDPATRMLTRRTYTIWDPEPSRGLDFFWTPDDPKTDKSGRINGSGYLAWRVKGKPTYERDSLRSEYRGTIRAGRIEGRGVFLDSAGLLYDGNWKSGLMDGLGTLKLPGGDEYVGAFRAGMANGTGRFIDITGEVYEGSFVNGYRNGAGRTTLPNGRTFSSKWTAGLESEVSRTVRIAQSGGKLTGGADDIRIGVTIDKRLPPSKKRDQNFEKGDVTYSISNTTVDLAVAPDNPRILSMWKGGGEIQLRSDEYAKGFDRFGVFSMVRGQFVPLNFNIEVQNRSQSQAQITGIYFDVATSATELQPALQMSVVSAFDTNYGPDGRYNPDYYVENFGWSDAQRAQLSFAFINSAGRPPAGQKILSLALGTIRQSTKVNFEPFLQAAGVNVAELKRASGANGFTCSGKVRSACLKELQASRIFGSLTNLVALEEKDFGGGESSGTVTITLAGKLDYGWQNAKGANQTAAAPFTIKLPLGQLLNQLERGEGGSREVVTAKGLELRLDQERYRVPVTFRSNVDAGRSARLLIPVEAAKSSSHAFTIVVQLSDGREIKSRPIRLLYYRPRWFSTSLG